MAFLRNMYCHICEKETSHNHMKCISCEERKYREKIAKWNALTNDEKLSDLRKRIEKLEAGPTRYA